MTDPRKNTIEDILTAGAIALAGAALASEVGNWYLERRAADRLEAASVASDSSTDLSPASGSDA